MGFGGGGHSASQPRSQIGRCLPHRDFHVVLKPTFGRQGHQKGCCRVCRDCVSRRGLCTPRELGKFHPAALPSCHLLPRLALSPSPRAFKNQERSTSRGSPGLELPTSAEHSTGVCAPGPHMCRAISWTPARVSPHRRVKQQCRLEEGTWWWESWLYFLPLLSWATASADSDKPRGQASNPILGHLTQKLRPYSVQQ